jgi:hypothetical protein
MAPKAPRSGPLFLLTLYTLVFALATHYWWAILHTNGPKATTPSSKDDASSHRLLDRLDEAQRTACLSLGLPQSSDVWITGSINWDRYVTPQFGYTIKSLVDHHGFFLVPFDHITHAHIAWKANGSNASQTLDEIALVSPTRRAPAAVLVWEAYSPEAIAWLRTAAPVFFFADDLHFRNQEQRAQKELTFKSVDVLFSTYAYNFRHFYPGVTSVPVKWLPHAAAPYFHFGTINRTAANSALLSGAISAAYPMRQIAQTVANADSRIAVVPHPGYGPVNRLNTTLYSQDRYAFLVRQYRASITCGLVYKYVVAKMMEIPATGSLLIVDESVVPQLSELGLLPQQHYLTYADATTLKHALDVALSTEEMQRLSVDRMRSDAQRVVLRRHTTFARAWQLAAELKLWSGAWRAKHENNSYAYCWDAFVSDATFSDETTGQLDFAQVSFVSQGRIFPQS